MKFSIDKAEATKALGLVSKCVVQRGSLPILQTIYVSADEDGNVQFRATDLETYIIAYAKANVEKSGSCCIDGILSSLIANFDEGDVVFTMGKGKVELTQKNRKHKIGFMSADEFPVFRVLEGYEPISTEEFVRAFSAISVAAGVDVSRPILQACYINSEDKFVVCADGYRIAKYDTVFPGVTTCVPAKSLSSFLLNELRSVDDAEAVFGEWNGIRCSKWSAVLSSLEGKYPDISPLIKSDAPACLEIDVDKNEFSKKLSICKLYTSKGGMQFVKLTHKGSELYLSVIVSDIGDMREDIEGWNGVGSDMSIHFNPTSVMDALNTFISSKVHIKFVSKNNPFTITDTETPALLHLLMPASVPEQEDNVVEEEGDF